MSNKTCCYYSRQRKKHSFFVKNNVDLHVDYYLPEYGQNAHQPPKPRWLQRLTTFSILIFRQTSAILCTMPTKECLHAEDDAASPLYLFMDPMRGSKKVLRQGYPISLRRQVRCVCRDGVPAHACGLGAPHF